jgi:hypothetical protein
MSWHFSQALEEEFSAVFCWDGGQSELWKSAPFARDDSCSDKMTGTSHLSPFGTMYVPSTDALGAELLMSYLEGFRAKTSARPETALDLKGPGVDCGANTQESSKKCSRVTCSSKTAHSLELAVLSESSKILPPSGTMRNGWYYPRKRSVPTICESGCGLQLPTPRSTDGDRGGRGDLLQAVRGNKNSHFKLYPTPQAYSKGNSKSMPGITALDIAVRPELAKHAVRAKERRKGAIELIPTPTARLGSAQRQPSSESAQKRYDQGRRNLEDYQAITGSGGPLNPMWVEWLMGWPLGWTDLELLATDKFQQWLQLHGVSCHP